MSESSHPEDISGSSQANGAPHETIYEIGLLLLPVLREDEIAAVGERVHTALASARASILAEEAPKKIQLAYRIERSVAGKREKYTEAHFGFVKFELPEEEEETAAPSIANLERLLRSDMQILRYLLIRTSREAPGAPRMFFTSSSLEGRTIEKPVSLPEEPRGEVDERELDKSIDALISPEL